VIQVAIEVAFDEEGKVLWIDQYPLKCLHKKGETFIKNYQHYEIVSQKLTTCGRVGCIETVVRLCEKHVWW
jgi:hypothetical protein